MEPLDGNAIAGELLEHFGAEMTTAVGTCAHCGTESVIAEARVYLRAPGAVARCRHCGSVTFVVVAGHVVNFSGFNLREAPDAG